MGVRVLAHAGLKLFIFTPVGTAGYFDSLGLPGPLADLVVAAEFFGGIGLILGLNIAARYPDASLPANSGIAAMAVSVPSVWHSAAALSGTGARATSWVVPEGRWRSLCDVARGVTGTPP